LNTNDLEKVFKQARSEYGSVNIDGDGYQACVYLGVKITKDDMTGEIKIYDPQKSVNYYVEIDKGLYSLFIKKGWLGAVIDITLSKYKEKLERIKESIAREMNGNQSPKRLRVLKEMREQILKKYYKLTQKLNKND
jgi:predicted DNA-binding transcriptional regulator